MSIDKNTIESIANEIIKADMMFDNECIFNIADIIIDSRELTKYINDINLDANSSLFVKTCFRCAGAYDSDNNILLNTKQIIKDAKNISIRNGLSKDEINYYVLLKILEVLFHELEHVFQHKQNPGIYYNNCSLKDLLYTASSNLPNLIYKDNYYIIPTERMAYINSNKLLLEVLKSNKDLCNDKIYLMFISNLFKRTIEGYKIALTKGKYPYNQFFHNVYGDESKIILSNLSFYDEDNANFEKNLFKLFNLDERLLYGLPISNTDCDDIIERLKKIKIYYESLPLDFKLELDKYINEMLSLKEGNKQYL